MPEIVLELKNINKTFNNVKVLDDINLEIEKGEVHVILGENGAGKSTLVNILGGLIKPNGGTIYYKGKKVTINNPKQAFMMGMNIVFQEVNLFDHYTIGENLLSHTFLNKKGIKNQIFKGIGKKRLIEDAQKILDEFGFDLKSSTKVRMLNHAEKRMIEIARALAIDADVIILDEPTSSITQKEKNILFKSLNDLKKKGVSIILVTQLLQDVIDVADRITVLRDGINKATVSIDKFESEKVIKLMSGEDYRNRYPKLNTLNDKVIFEARSKKPDNEKDINFKLHKGEILGIAGLVGSGRSLLAKKIFGYVSFDESDIFINGKKVKINSPVDAMKNGIAYIPDDRATYGVFKNMNIRENLISNHIPFLHKFFINWGEQNRIMTSYLDKIEIKMYSVMDNISILSEGNKQKVMLLKWLTKNANIFIFDEPTAGIDTTSKVDIYNLMADLLMKGASIILLSSDINELLGLSDRILIMHKGSIVERVNSKEISIEQLYQYLVRS
jgi:ribose transport system ATP-binding protein